MPPKQHHQNYPHQQQQQQYRGGGGDRGPAHPQNSAAHHHQQPQNKNPSSPPPPVQDFIASVLRHGANYQGGACAQCLASHPYGHLHENVKKTYSAQAERLPPKIPAYLVNQNQGARVQVLQTLYEVARFFLQAVLVHTPGSSSSATSPRDRLEAMLNAYTAFESLHKEERGPNGAAGGALLQTPGQVSAPANVGWDTAILVVLCQKIRALAQVEGALSNDGGLLNDLINKWRKMFLFLVSSDPGVANNIARRRGALVVLNCLLAVLFHLGNFPQVKALLQSVDQLESQSNGDPNKGVFGPCGHIKSEVTKILYYQGRVKLYNGQEQVSIGLFAQVAERLPPLKVLASVPQKPSSNQFPLHRNKTRALFYLCINSILCGIAPDVAGIVGRDVDPVLFSILNPMVDAINAGSSTKLNRVLSDPFIVSTLQCRSVYLQVKQLYLLTVLVGIKRIHSLLAEMGLDNSRMEMKCIAQVVKTLDEEAVSSSSSKNIKNEKEQNSNDREDDSAAITKNSSSSNNHNDLSLIVDIGQLIQLGWLKGYVAFDHGILVLSKANPFPRRVAL